MLQKLLWFILIFIELKITVDAAVYIIPPQKKPPKYACYDAYCYIEELDKILAYDEPYFPRDGKSCLKYECSKKDNSTTVFSCGAIDFPDSCERVPGNKYLAYPDCCDSFRCFAVDPVEPQPVIDPIETDPIEEPEEQYPEEPTVSDPTEPVPDTGTVDPILVDPVPDEPNPNIPTIPTNPQPPPNPPLPPTKQPLPIQPRPIRPPICPLYATNKLRPHNYPPYCKPIIRPIYATQPVPATTV